MEKISLAVALVQKVENGKTQLLLRKHPQHGQFRFIVGNRLEQESFRETIVREIAWQLNLKRDADFIVANMAQLEMEWSDILPGERTVKRFVVSFYPAHLYRSSVLKSISENEEHRWVTNSEICDGMTVDHQPIDPLIVNWINQWQVLRPWTV